MGYGQGPPRFVRALVSFVVGGERAPARVMTDDVRDDELEPDDAESNHTDDDSDRAPQPGNVPAPERPLFDPDADDGEEE